MLKDDLYRLVIQDLVRRIEHRKAADNGRAGVASFPEMPAEIGVLPATRAGQRRRPAR